MIEKNIENYPLIFPFCVNAFKRFERIFPLVVFNERGGAFECGFKVKTAFFKAVKAENGC